jgi:hypothetical protein
MNDVQLLPVALGILSALRLSFVFTTFAALFLFAVALVIADAPLFLTAVASVVPAFLPPVLIVIAAFLPVVTPVLARIIRDK